MEFYDILIIIAVIWVFIYTASYGVWTFKENNKMGAIAIFVLDAFVVILPAIMYYLNY